MDRPAFSKVEEVYHAARERPPQERELFLAETCGADAALLGEVRSLLGLAEQAGRFLEEPAADAATLKLVDLRGARLGAYAIVERIGAGGMGEVYRARDTRLGREVAIKALPDEALGDADRRRRFEREARSAAALNHPNIATVHDVGEHEGRLFIAMELVEGRTLAERLAAGPLPVTEVLALGSQIARGLARAHAAGFVHRDLKPANLMVTSDGLVKILDFGLARRADPSPGVESAITRDGSVLGTAQYMSPEQAAGRPLDHRSDQFSLGAILYEMAAGKRAFERDSVPQTLAAVIQEEPEPLRKRNPAIPEDLARIVERCLAKDPVGRFDSTKDLVRALELASVATTRAPVRRATGAWWAWAAAASLVAVGGAALVRHYSHPAAPAKADASLEVVPLTTYPGREGEPTFSPDGSQVAFSWDGGDEQNLDIYVKAIGAEPPLRLTSDPASDGSPAWSPDGTRIAFLRERSGGGSEVLVVPPVGGPERRLAEVEGRADEGLAWSPDGRSLAVVDRVTPQEPAGIFLLDLATGSKMRLTSPRAPTWDDQPAFSPDGATVAFLRPPLLGVFLVSARGGEPRMLTAEGNWRNRLAWSPDGQAVLLAAERFPGVGERPQQSTGGAPAALVWRVPVDGTPPRAVRGTTNAGDVAVSGAGRLAYSQETVDFDVWRVDLRPPGKAPEPPTRLIASTKIDTNPQFSPDGERVAFVSVRSGQAEVWIVDRDGRRPLQLTSVGRDGGVGAPRWSPDGRNIAFDFSPVGQAMVNIYVVDASGGAPRRVTRSSAVDATPSWSRDGRWIYFGSNRSGGWQVWKVPATGEEPGGARQVTRGGGFAAIESTDGRYLYFTKRLSGSHDPRNSIWRLPVAGGEEEVAVDSFRASSGSWDLTVDGIYFVDQLTPSSPGQWVVRFLPFAQRRSSVVARLARPPYPFGPAVSVSPDGRWMLSAQGEGTSDLMLVEGFE